MESKSLNREKIKRHFCCCNTKNSFPENLRELMCGWIDICYDTDDVKNCKFDLPSEERGTPYTNSTFKITYIKNQF